MFIAASIIVASNGKQPDPSTANARTYLAHVYPSTQQRKEQNKTRKQTARASNSMDEEKNMVCIGSWTQKDTP